MQAQHIFACEWNPDALEGTVECRSVIQIRQMLLSWKSDQGLMKDIHKEFDLKEEH